MPIKKGIKLKFAISLLVVFTACSTAIINWYISIQALKDNITESHLENNYQYATKLAISTNNLLFNMKQNLSTLANIIGKEEFSQSDLDHWQTANSGYYNSLFTTDSSGVVQLMSPLVVPNNKNGVHPGTKITSELMQQALKNKKPFISDPYLAQTGNLVVLISYPIFDNAGNYLGVVDGTIYLEKSNSLQKILYNHDFLDESSVFVVDRNGKIIYHPDTSRINESVANHPLVQKVIQGKNGSAKIINNRGIEYFSGYAYVEQTGWGIITQTPTFIIEEPLHMLTQKTIMQSLPLLLTILLIAWVFTNHISKPINTLARYSEEATQSNKQAQPIHHIEMTSYIYEVRQLYQHLQKHFQLLNNQIQQDGLTGLANRRSFDQEIELLIKQKIPFSLIMIDIDHFKKVNDEHGHLVGDDVLRFLATIMHHISREEDLCYRYGGEEFAILLKQKGVDDAFALAERLRIKVSETISPAGEAITISLGISSSRKDDLYPEMIIKRADSALYKSKNEGRNRTTIYEFSNKD